LLLDRGTAALPDRARHAAPEPERAVGRVHDRVDRLLGDVALPEPDPTAHARLPRPRARVRPPRVAASVRSTSAAASSGTRISCWPISEIPRPPSRVGRSTTFTAGR